MKKIEELRDYLLENYVDENGNLNISHLDFSDFQGNVCIDNMKVKGTLFQHAHEVQGDLIQSGHEVRGHLYQHGHEVQGSLNQHGHEVQGSLYQYGHEVKGNLSQGGQEVKGDLYSHNNKYGGDLHETPSTKLLKEVTAEELAELGYTLKGEQ